MSRTFILFRKNRTGRIFVVYSPHSTPRAYCGFHASARTLRFGHSTIAPARDKRKPTAFWHLGMEYFNEPEFHDPADWNAASYNAHPIDSIEPLPDHHTGYRDAALECMKILRSVDAFMSQERDPRLAWVAISCTLELTSTSKLTEAEIARQIGVFELRVRRAVTKFTRLADIDSSGGLRALGRIRSNGGLPSKKTVGAG
jgi:hypothetical protein